MPSSVVSSIPSSVSEHTYKALTEHFLARAAACRFIKIPSNGFTLLGYHEEMYNTLSLFSFIIGLQFALYGLGIKIFYNFNDYFATPYGKQVKKRRECGFCIDSSIFFLKTRKIRKGSGKWSCLPLQCNRPQFYS